MKLILLLAIIIAVSAAESLHFTEKELAQHQVLREITKFFEVHDPNALGFAQHFKTVVIDTARLIEHCNIGCLTSCMNTPGLTMH